MVGPGGSRNGNYGGYQGGAPRRDGWQRQAEQQAQPAAAETLPENYADAAEAVILGLLHEDRGGKMVIDITSSKIRRLFSLITPIYNKERLRTEEKITTESKQALMMARVRIAYEAGRDNTVKNFIAQAKLMEYIKGAGDDREKFVSFAHYMEALVAWHRYHGGRA